MTKEEYKQKLEELFYKYPPGPDRKRINEKLLLINEIYEYDYSENRVMWLRQLAEEFLQLLEDGREIMPTMTDVKDLARGTFQLNFWLEQEKNKDEYCSR